MAKTTIEVPDIEVSNQKKSTVGGASSDNAPDSLQVQRKWADRNGQDYVLNMYDREGNLASETWMPRRAYNEVRRQLTEDGFVTAGLEARVPTDVQPLDAFDVFELEEWVEDQIRGERQDPKFRDKLRRLYRPFLRMLFEEDTRKMLVTFLSEASGVDLTILNNLLYSWDSARTDYPDTESPLLVALQRMSQKLSALPKTEPREGA